jgi:hypothetical protein
MPHNRSQSSGGKWRSAEVFLFQAMPTRSMRRAAAFAAIFFTLHGCATARPAAPAGDSRSYIGRPTRAAITAGDLRTRLYIFADDSMGGRAAGTPFNLRGTAYIERELRRLGVEPAGENGTYFQDIGFVSRTISRNSSITVDGRTFALEQDFVPRDMGPGMRSIDGAVAIYGGTWGDSATRVDSAAVAGKLVVLSELPGQSINRFAASRLYRKAAAIVVASLDEMSPAARSNILEPSLDLAAEAPVTGTPTPAFIYASNALVSALFGGTSPASLKTGEMGKRVGGGIAYTRRNEPPGRNVIAVIRGSNPSLRGQFVALGAHNDHEPPRAVAVDHDSVRAYNTVVRPSGAESPNVKPTEDQLVRVRAILDSLRAVRPPRRDSIMNGADDDGSGSMALLEIAEAFATSKTKPERSLLFVWHTGEELGLVGSDWFTRHPTVPLDSIVTQLNIDMIGRGGSNDAVHDTNGKPVYGSPDFIEIVGSRRLSTELGDIVDAANQSQPRPLAFSHAFDTTGEPHQMYCRSDHYMYARFGIPITFFFTSVHRDYHQVTDEPQYIDYEKYARIVNLIHDIAQRVGDLDHRPVVDKPRPNPAAGCIA